MRQRPMTHLVPVCCAILLLAAAGQCRQKSTPEDAPDQRVRQPVVAGAFYPDDGDLLAQQVDHFLANVPRPSLPGHLVALVVPHAGYIFSGKVAAYSYKLLQGMDIKTVILLGCSHRGGYWGASIYDRGSYQTPLGQVPIDAEVAQEVISRVQGLRYLPEAHQTEHSLEVQVPFLQRTLGDVRLVPILLGQQRSLEDLETLAQAIAQVAEGQGKDRVLLVASTDMSHYPEYETAYQVDGETMKILETLDPRALADHEARWLNRGIPNLHCTLCATEAVMVAMMAAKALGANGIEILKYANSGDVPAGDHDRVVGYCAAALYIKEAASSEGPKEATAESDELSPQEQQALLVIARESIAARLKGDPYSPPESSLPRLKELRGAFVTLHKNGALRGCIGRFLPDIPLIETVTQMAQAAAFEDGRFQPLEGEELDEVQIEISVLSPLKEIDSIDQIEMGKHGIWITRGGHSGCYLPQVAAQTGWSKKEFLEHCCRDKAFLPKDAYLQEGTHIYVFTAQVFEER